MLRDELIYLKVHAFRGNLSRRGMEVRNVTRDFLKNVVSFEEPLLPQ